ncbi:MAG: sigma-70 family RNA polymerase sigma factor, partial [Opitutales bacterium]|nr:sigma-70 family RNA polymerase sigma factor [Opitutales bacterium]
MVFIDTPKSMIEQMLESSENSAQWQVGWQRFFDIYYPVLRHMARSGFAKFGFETPPESAVDDVVSDTFQSMVKMFQSGKYDKTRRFRGFLKTLVHRKAVDYMRKNRRLIAPQPFDEAAQKIFEGQNARPDADEREDMLFRLARIREIFECIRLKSFDPQTLTIFEMVKLEGKPPKEVMKELGVKRNIVDNSVYKVMKK